MSIILYFHEPASLTPGAEYFGSKDLTKVLASAEAHRKAGHIHVCISSELDEHVGGFGVNTVADGKTPDGEIYDWSKADRAGKTRKSDATKQSVATKNGD